MAKNWKSRATLSSDPVGEGEPALSAARHLRDVSGLHHHEAVGEAAEELHPGTAIHELPLRRRLRAHAPPLGRGTLHGVEGLPLEGLAIALDQAHGRVEEQRLLLVVDVVAAGLQAELHGAVGRLVELGDQHALRVADVEAAVEPGSQHDRAGRLAHVGDHDVAGARHADVVGGVLRPALRRGRLRERLVERELVGLVERDPAVTGGVGGAAQAREEGVGEVGPLDPLRLLGRLVRGARGQERIALHLHRLVGQEAGLLLAALEPRDDARGAGVEDPDADVGGDAAQRVLELAVAQQLASQEQALLVGVARVVDDHLGPALAGPRFFGAAPHHGQAVEHGAPGGLAQHDAVGRRHAAHLLQQPRHALGVGDGPAQGHAVAAPVVGADDQRDTAHGRRGPGEARKQEESGEHGGDSAGFHRRSSFLRVNEDCSSGEGRASGSLPAAPVPARRAAASTTGATSKGRSAVTSTNRSHPGASSRR